MNRLAPLLSLATLVLAVLYVEFRIAAPPPPPPAAAGPDASELAAIADRLAAVERGLSALAAPPAPEPAAGGPPPAPGPEEPAAPPTAPAAGSPARAEAVDALLAGLKAGRLSEADVDRLWELLPGSGREDAAIAALREYAQAHAGDADAWYGLGAALTSKLIGGQVSFLEQGSLSAQADKAFTKALEVDDRHFGARYSRAVSYTFWPEGLGKGPDAIRDFEILRERHRGDASIEVMEDVYLNLAIQYRKAGDAKRAEEVLREGLETFPGSEALRKHLEGPGGK